MATFTDKGLLQRDDPIFKEPVSRFPVRLGRKSAGSKMFSPSDADGLPTEPPASGTAPDKPKPE